MKIRVDYVAQLKDAAGRADEVVELADGTNLQDLIRQVAARRGERLAGLLLDDGGELRPSALVFVGDDQIEWHDACPLHDGATVTLMSPLAGG
jgi:molybdopterin converting factor small subunit